MGDLAQPPAFGGNAAFYISRDMAENVFGGRGYTRLRVQVPAFSDAAAEDVVERLETAVGEDRRARLLLSGHAAQQAPGARHRQRRQSDPGRHGHHVADVGPVPGHQHHQCHRRAASAANRRHEGHRRNDARR